MKEKGVTTITLKKINKEKVYQYIYHEKQTAKQQIVLDLQMGLSTVSQNLALLEQEGMIRRDGYFESTGGRKAQVIQIVTDFRIAIGIGILKNMFHIVAVDLYGETMAMNTVSVPYVNTPNYYSQVASSVEKFIQQNHYDPDRILGVSVATQGVISPDGSHVTYGAIMNNAEMKLSDFASRIPYPCHLEHDSKSAAALELWSHSDLDSGLSSEPQPWRCYYHQPPGSSGIYHAQRNCRAYVCQPGRSLMLLRQPGLSGNLLFCQFPGSCCRNVCERIFPCLKKRLFTRTSEYLEGLPESPGLCHQKSEYDYRQPGDHQWISGSIFYTGRSGYITDTDQHQQSFHLCP